MRRLRAAVPQTAVPQTTVPQTAVRPRAPRSPSTVASPGSAGSAADSPQWRQEAAAAYNHLDEGLDESPGRRPKHSLETPSHREPGQVEDTRVLQTAAGLWMDATDISPTRRKKLSENQSQLMRGAVDVWTDGGGGGGA